MILAGDIGGTTTRLALFGRDDSGRLQALTDSAGRFVLRGASPQIMTGLRQALSIGIILMVISEMFASSSGLGFAIVQFQRTFAIPEMWAGMVLLGVIGFLLSSLFELVEGRVLGWYRGLRAANRGE